MKLVLGFGVGCEVALPAGFRKITSSSIFGFDHGFGVWRMAALLGGETESLSLSKEALFEGVGSLGLDSREELELGLLLGSGVGRIN